MRWPLSGLEDAQQLFALAEAVEEDGERADVHGVGAEPDQVRVDAHQLHHQHADPLRAGRDLKLQQLLDRERIAEVVRHRRKVVDAIGQRDDLLVELGLAGLLDARMQIPDVRREGDDRFAVDLQHEAEHAVGRRVLRAHVEDHGLVGEWVVAVVVALGVGDDVLDSGDELAGVAHARQRGAGLLTVLRLGCCGLWLFEVGDCH